MGVQITKNTLGDGALASGLSGLVGQIAGSLVWVPSEIVKELRQMTGVKSALQGQGVIGSIRYVLKTEGIAGLYRGFIPQLLTFGPFNSLGMYVSSQLQRRVGEENRDKLWCAFLCHASAFGLAAAVTTPLDVIKTRIQVHAADPQAFPLQSMWGCVRSIIKMEGVVGLSSGIIERSLWLGLRQGIAMTTFGVAYKQLSTLLAEPEAALESAAPRRI
jgi:hypothetical protein